MKKRCNGTRSVIAVALAVASGMAFAQQGEDGSAQSSGADEYCNRVKSSPYVAQYNRDAQRLGEIFDLSPTNYISMTGKVDKRYFSGYVENFLDNDQAALSEKLKGFLDRYPEKYQNDKLASKYVTTVLLASSLKNARACAESTGMSFFREQPLSVQSPVSNLLTDWRLWEKIDRLLNWNSSPKQNRTSDPRAGLDLAESVLRELTPAGAFSATGLSKRFASYLVFNFRNADAILGKIERPHGSAFDEKFAALKVLSDAETNRRKGEERAAQAKIDYEKLPDGVLEKAYGEFVAIERCFKVREGYATVYVTEPQYLRSRASIKAIESKLKPQLKGDPDKIWKRANENTKFTARSSGFSFDDLIPGACRGYVSSLEDMHDAIMGKSAPRKSF